MDYHSEVKRATTDTCNNINKSPKHYVKSKGSQKENILFDSFICEDTFFIYDLKNQNRSCFWGDEGDWLEKSTE